MKEAIDYVASTWNNVSQMTIQNCWTKTGIVPSYDDEMDDDTNDDTNSEDDDEIEDLLNELPDNDEIREYFQRLDHEIPVEEYLTEGQIINMVQADNEDRGIGESENDDDDDEEITPVSIKKAIDGLNTFIGFFEQQNDVEFDVNDLRIFRKYVRVIRIKEIRSKKQRSLDLFFNNCGI